MRRHTPNLKENACLIVFIVPSEVLECQLSYLLVRLIEIVVVKCKWESYRDYSNVCTCIFGMKQISLN